MDSALKSYIPSSPLLEKSPVASNNRYTNESMGDGSSKTQGNTNINLNDTVGIICMTILGLGGLYIAVRKFRPSNVIDDSVNSKSNNNCSATSSKNGSITNSIKASNINNPTIHNIEASNVGTINSTSNNIVLGESHAKFEILKLQSDLQSVGNSTTFVSLAWEKIASQTNFFELVQVKVFHKDINFSLYCHMILYITPEHTWVNSFFDTIISRQSHQLLPLNILSTCPSSSDENQNTSKKLLSTQPLYVKSLLPVIFRTFSMTLSKKKEICVELCARYIESYESRRHAIANTDGVIYFRDIVLIILHFIFLHTQNLFVDNDPVKTTFYPNFDKSVRFNGTWGRLKQDFPYLFDELSKLSQLESGSLYNRLCYYIVWRYNNMLLYTPTVPDAFTWIRICLNLLHEWSRIYSKHPTNNDFTNKLSDKFRNIESYIEVMQSLGNTTMSIDDDCFSILHRDLNDLI